MPVVVGVADIILVPPAVVMVEEQILQQAAEVMVQIKILMAPQAVLTPVEVEVAEVMEEHQDKQAALVLLLFVIQIVLQQHQVLQVAQI
jgi:hypothetical protein